MVHICKFRRLCYRYITYLFVKGIELKPHWAVERDDDLLPEVNLLPVHHEQSTFVKCILEKTQTGGNCVGVISKKVISPLWKNLSTHLSFLFWWEVYECAGQCSEQLYIFDLFSHFIVQSVRVFSGPSPTSFLKPSVYSKFHPSQLKYCPQL